MSAYPVIGRPACWCGRLPEEHTGDDHAATRPGPSLRSTAELEQAVSGVEIVATDPDRPYRQRRLAWTDDAGRRGHGIATWREGRGELPGCWVLSWADETGWILATDARVRGWLDAIDYGPDTYGHVDYVLP